MVCLTGSSTCIISILRLQSLYAISKASDVTWENPLAAIWSVAEVDIGILCSCLPTLKGCVTRFFPTLFNSSDRSRSGAEPVEMPFRSLSSRKASGVKLSEGREQREVQRPEKTHSHRNINVVTVLEQEVEHDRRDDESSAMESDSVRRLVRQGSYHGI